MGVNQTQTMDKKILPSKDRQYLESKGYQFQEINDGANCGLIINNFNIVPEEKFIAKQASLLIILPKGYPDIPPDMFYFDPELRLISNNNHPDRASEIVVHFEKKWQQWSRHADANEWRTGQDGIHSYLQRVFRALQVA